MNDKLKRLFVIINAAAGLVDWAPDAPDTEYERGIINLICDVSGYGLNEDDYATIQKLIRG